MPDVDDYQLDFKMPTQDDLANLVTPELEKQVYEVRMKRKTKQDSDVPALFDDPLEAKAPPERRRSIFGKNFTGLQKVSQN